MMALGDKIELHTFGSSRRSPLATWLITALKPTNVADERAQSDGCAGIQFSRR